MYSSESFEDSSPLDALIAIWSQDVEKVIFNTLFRLSSLTCLIVVWDGGAFFSQCVIQWHAFLLRLSDNWFSLLQCLWIVFYNKVVDFCNKVIYSYISTLFKILSTAWNFVAFFITLVLQEVLVLGCSVALHLWTSWLFWKQTSCESFLDHISVLDGFGQNIFSFDTLLIHVAYDTCYFSMHVTFDTCYVLIHVTFWYMLCFDTCYSLIHVLHVTFVTCYFLIHVIFHKCYTCYFLIHVIFS